MENPSIELPLFLEILSVGKFANMQNAKAEAEVYSL